METERVTNGSRKKPECFCTTLANPVQIWPTVAFSDIDFQPQSFRNHLKKKDFFGSPDYWELGTVVALSWQYQIP